MTSSACFVISAVANGRAEEDDDDDEVVSRLVVGVVWVVVALVWLPAHSSSGSPHVTRSLL